MSLEQRFRDLVQRSECPTPVELDELYDAASPVTIADMIGEWGGGTFGTGHPAEAQLAAVNWAGKSFGGPDDVAPIICADASGGRYVNDLFGGAALVTDDYRGSATAAMRYEDQPMTDYFRAVSPDVVIGAMERAGGSAPGYFFLERLADATRPRRLEFRSGQPEIEVIAAVLCEAGGAYVLERAEIEAPGPGEVLVRVEATGICHSDLVVGRSSGSAQLPRVLGHEGVGIVEAIGEQVTDVLVGDRVVMSFNWCGHCANCAKGRMAYCANSGPLNLSGLRLDGTPGMRGSGGPIRARFCGQSSFATYALASAHTVVPVPQDIPVEVLAPLGCGIQTGAGTVFNALQPEAGSAIAVFATGSVGLAAVMAARVAGCDRIVAVDPMPQRREAALALGATVAVHPDEVKSATRGGVDYAVDCIGKPEVVRAAIGTLASPGVCATIGVQGFSVPIELDQAKMVVRGQSLRGVTEGDAVPRQFIPELIGLYRDGVFPVDKLVTTFPFAKINDAIDATRRGDAVKAVLLF